MDTQFLAQEYTLELQNLQAIHQALGISEQLTTPFKQKIHRVRDLNFTYQSTKSSVQSQVIRVKEEIANLMQKIQNIKKLSLIAGDCVHDRSKIDQAVSQLFDKLVSQIETLEFARDQSRREQQKITTLLEKKVAAHEVLQKRLLERRRELETGEREREKGEIERDNLSHVKMQKVGEIDAMKQQIEDCNAKIAGIEGEMGEIESTIKKLKGVLTCELEPRLGEIGQSLADEKLMQQNFLISLEEKSKNLMQEILTLRRDTEEKGEMLMRKEGERETLEKEVENLMKQEEILSADIKVLQLEKKKILMGETDNEKKIAHQNLVRSHLSTQREDLRRETRDLRQETEEAEETAVRLEKVRSECSRLEETAKVNNQKMMEIKKKISDKRKTILTKESVMGKNFMAFDVNWERLETANRVSREDFMKSFDALREMAKEIGETGKKETEDFGEIENKCELLETETGQKKSELRNIKNLLETVDAETEEIATKLEKASDCERKISQLLQDWKDSCELWTKLSGESKKNASKIYNQELKIDSLKSEIIRALEKARQLLPADRRPSELPSLQSPAEFAKSNIKNTSISTRCETEAASDREGEEREESEAECELSIRRPFATPSKSVINNSFHQKMLTTPTANQKRQQRGGIGEIASKIHLLSKMTPVKNAAKLSQPVSTKISPARDFDDEDSAEELFGAVSTAAARPYATPVKTRVIEPVSTPKIVETPSSKINLGPTSAAGLNRIKNAVIKNLNSRQTIKNKINKIDADDDIFDEW